jgi:hypothetical protein
MRWFFVLGLCLTSAGCMRPVPIQVVPRRAPFIPAEYEPYGRPGTATIVGQAFLKTRGGDVKYCAGEPVSLNPVTTYSREWWNVVVLGRREIEPGDPRAQGFHRTTIADAEGRFRFPALPAGEYYVACHVAWEVPGASGLEGTGGWAASQIKVEDGATVEAILIDARRFFGTMAIPIPATTVQPGQQRTPVDPACPPSQRLMGLCTPAPVRPADTDSGAPISVSRPPHRQGAYLVAGGGFASLDCNDCGDRASGSSAWLGLGSALSGKNSLGIEGRFWIEDEAAWFGTVALAWTAYLNERSGLFATTGIGAALAHAGDTEAGVGVLATLGYDIPLGFAAFTPYIAYDFTLGGIDGIDYNNLGIGGAFRLR